MNRREAFVKKRDSLKDILVDLENRILKDCEAHVKQLLRTTSELTEKIRTCERKHVSHYVKKWFTLFLGARDECLVLLNGALRRSYYKVDFKDYIHAREKEAYLHGGAILSKLSTDGIDYEYRELVDTYGEKSVPFILLVFYFQLKLLCITL
jgi:hypothetical protein